MDDKKKQIILISVCAALALGAGSYYMFFREGGGADQGDGSAGPAVRKVREKPAVPAKVAKKEAKARPEEDAKPTERKVRDPAEEQQLQRKARDNDRKIEKKKVSKPAA